MKLEKESRKGVDFVVCVSLCALKKFRHQALKMNAFKNRGLDEKQTKSLTGKLVALNMLAGLR